SPGKGPEGIPPSPLRGFGGQDGGQPSRGWQLSERNGASGEARAECSEPKRGAGGKSARSADPLAPELEAPPGFEPGMEVLQSHPRSLSCDRRFVRLRGNSLGLRWMRRSSARV